MTIGPKGISVKPLKFVAKMAISTALLLICGFQSAERTGRDARPGEVASGEVISSDDMVLSLNTSPCDRSQTIVTFHNPYRKIRSDGGACNGRRYDRVEVEQQ